MAGKHGGTRGRGDASNARNPCKSMVTGKGEGVEAVGGREGGGQITSNARWWFE